ncbi:MAG TPA: S4 domain-containing protein, partial [Actinomycetota bacterium]|nr:S4 domain-containing protein [Actinomycetota bacterium]
DQARQFVTHGHFQVNGRKVDIPSYRVKAGDVVAVRERSRSVGRIVEAAAFAAGRHIPEWLILEAGELKISVVSEPARELIDVPVQEQMIVELYSK